MLYKHGDKRFPSYDQHQVSVALLGSLCLYFVIKKRLSSFLYNTKFKLKSNLFGVMMYIYKLGTGEVIISKACVNSKYHS